jgi:hypothetical protein
MRAVAGITCIMPISPELPMEVGVYGDGVGQGGGDAKALRLGAHQGPEFFAVGAGVGRGAGKCVDDRRRQIQHR